MSTVKRPDRFRRTGMKPILLSLAAAAMLPGMARAALVVEMPGDGSKAPYYIGQAYFGATYENGPSDSFAIQDGIVWSSNAGPRGMVSASGSYSQNGATMTVNAWSVANGFYSARNYASMTVTNAQAIDGYYAVAGYGTRTQVQFFTPQALAERSVFTWRVTGLENEPIGWVDARLDFLAAPHSDAQFIDVYDSGVTHYGPGDYVYVLNAALNEPIDLFFWSSAFVQLNRGVASQGSTVTLMANYGSTYELVGIELYDGNDRLIDNWTLVDLVSGRTVFDQNGRIDPATVPEPGALVLLTLGLLGIAGSTRGRSRGLEAKRG